MRIADAKRERQPAAVLIIRWETEGSVETALLDGAAQFGQIACRRRPSRKNVRVFTQAFGCSKH
jgi:hypothetical protein